MYGIYTLPSGGPDKIKEPPSSLSILPESPQAQDTNIYLFPSFFLDELNVCGICLYVPTECHYYVF